MSLSLDITKQLGSFHLQTKFSCGNEVLSLLGASGCGKSVTLKCIAGIIRPDKGTIELDGRTLFDRQDKINLPLRKRRVGLLFQNYALFPNMTVLQNIRTGLKRDGMDEAKAGQFLTRFGLTDIADSYPSQISGGQQQRTALARLLISGPDILLLDEPFSALDSHLRFRMEAQLRELIREFGKTVILVSHNRDEVYRLSDRVAVMKDGAIDVCGTRDEVFGNPGTRNAAILTGCKNVSPVRIEDEHHLLASDWGLRLLVSKIPEGTKSVGIRMHYIFPGEGENAFRCAVLEEIENPFSYTLMLKNTEAPEEGAPFGWDVDKEFWNKNRAGLVTVHIPEQSLHYLRD